MNHVSTSDRQRYWRGPNELKSSLVDYCIFSPACSRIDQLSFFEAMTTRFDDLGHREGYDGLPLTSGRNEAWALGVDVLLDIC